MDLSEMTINICLEKSDDFVGGTLYFGGQRGSSTEVNKHVLY
jgi:hypothetical protein